VGHIYYIKWVTTEYVPHWGTKVGHIYFYIILCIQLYRTGARQTEITLTEFHCMINIAETNYLKWQLSGGGKRGYKQYLAFYWLNKQTKIPLNINYQTNKNNIPKNINYFLLPIIEKLIIFGWGWGKVACQGFYHLGGGEQKVSQKQP